MTGFKIKVVVFAETFGNRSAVREYGISEYRYIYILYSAIFNLFMSFKLWVQFI